MSDFWHHDDGSHRSTAPTANGSDLDRFERGAAVHVAHCSKDRLEYLRGEIRAERISYGEIAELQSLAEHIGEGDVELLEWAGVSE